MRVTRATATPATTPRLGSATTYPDDEMYAVVRSHHANGAPQWRMPSGSRRSVWHVVTFDAERSALICSCPAGQYGRGSCRHRAIVQATLLADRAVLTALLDAAEDKDNAGDSSADEDETTWALTPKARAYLEARQRDTAPLLRDNRPISLWK